MGYRFCVRSIIKIEKHKSETTTKGISIMFQTVKRLLVFKKWK